jgi:hypothetical protein
MNNFFVLNFAEGSGGKFTNSILQTSDQIGHWDIEVNRAKNKNSFADKFLEYTKKSFPTNLNNHLKMEPCLPFNFEGFSSIFSNTNLSYEKAMKILEDKPYCKEIFSNSQKLSLILHKDTDEFLKDSDIVTLCIDSKYAKRFTQKACIHKRYGVNENYILYKMHHPDYCNPSSANLARKYINENKPYRNISKIQFLKTEILDKKLYQPYENLNGKGIISLTNLITDTNTAVKEFKKVFDNYNLSGFNEDLIAQAHSIWFNGNNKIILEN